MSAKKLQGVLTAIVTPMNQDGSLDFGALDAFVDFQLHNGVDGLVACGSTGEGAALTATEKDELTRHVVKRVGGRVPVIAGAGNNITAAAIEAQKRAKDTGADAALVVTPYYNKPTPEGLYRHYAALSEAVDFATILYNVPGRTGCDLKPDTVGRIAKLPGVVGMKEATGDLDRVGAIRALTPPEFALLSGDDATCCAFVWLGGDGVISTTSNVAPKAKAEMIHWAQKGDVPNARRLHNALRPLFSALFWEANPIPVKAALAAMGHIQENYRLPLCEMSREPKAKLLGLLKDGGFLG